VANLLVWEGTREQYLEIRQESEAGKMVTILLETMGTIGTKEKIQQGLIRSTTKMINLDFLEEMAPIFRNQLLFLDP
jgi:hypothetical protein